MRIRFKGLLLMVSVLLVGRMNAQKAFTLSEAQTYALENNLDFKNSDLEIQIAKKKVWEATSTGLPQLNGEFNLNHFMDIGVMPFPNDFTDPSAGFSFPALGLANTMDYGVTASQLIFNGSYFIGLKAAKSYVTVSENMRDKKASDIKEQVANAYYLVLAAQENKSIIAENVKSMTKLYNETKELNVEGMVETMEVDQLSLNLANLTASEQEANAMLQSTKALLNFHLGLATATEVELKETLEEVVTKLDPAVAQMAFDIREHIDYKSLDTKEKLDLLNWRNEQARMLPTISAFYSYKQTTYGSDMQFTESNDFADLTGESSWFPQQLVGLKVSMPLFTSFQGGSRMKQAKLALEQTRNQKSMVEQSLRMQANTSKSDYLTAIAQYTNAKNSVALSKDLYEKSLVKYKEGLISSFELNQMKAQELGAQGSYVQSIVNVLNKKLALDKAYSKL